VNEYGIADVFTASYYVVILIGGFGEVSRIEDFIVGVDIRVGDVVFAEGGGCVIGILVRWMIWRVVLLVMVDIIGRR